jgi:hypothetical protein
MVRGVKMPMDVDGQVDHGGERGGLLNVRVIGPLLRLSRYIHDRVAPSEALSEGLTTPSYLKLRGAQQQHITRLIALLSSIRHAQVKSCDILRSY